jgi:cytochrome c oxidase cbb3-type subunit IV
MDINDFRIVYTLVSFGVFVGIVAWAYSRGARRGFEEAARLPLVDDGIEPARVPASRGDGR